MNILALCDYTGAMAAPWLDAGHNVWSVDLQHGGRPGGMTSHTGGVWRTLALDVADLIDRRGNSVMSMIDWDMIFAFPPCTHLAVSGAKHFKSKGLAKLRGALEVVQACEAVCLAAGCPFMIENPISTLATYWRKSDYIIQPWHYNLDRHEDTYFKSTCLWTGGGFKCPIPRTDPRTIQVMADTLFKYPELQGKQTKLMKAAQNDPDIDDTWYPDDRIHKAPPSEERGDIRSETPMGFSMFTYEDNK